MADESPKPPKLPKATRPLKQRYVTYLADGTPVPSMRSVYTENQLRELYRVAWASPYIQMRDPVTNELLPGEEDYEGLTIGEAANHRVALNASRGCLESFKYITDRMLGKPKQQIEQTQLSLTYADYLDQLEKKRADYEAHVEANPAPVMAELPSPNEDTVQAHIDAIDVTIKTSVPATVQTSVADYVGDL